MIIIITINRYIQYTYSSYKQQTLKYNNSTIMIVFVENSSSQFHFAWFERCELKTHQKPYALFIERPKPKVLFVLLLLLLLLLHTYHNSYAYHPKPLST